MNRPIPSRVSPFGSRAGTAVLCAAAILVLSLLVYSPLHRDDPQQRHGVCPFCQFQHLAAEPAGTQAAALVPLRTLAALHLAEPEFHTRLLRSPHSGRAPPASTPSV